MKEAGFELGLKIWVNRGWARGLEGLLRKREQVMNKAQKTEMDHICRTNHVNIHSNSSLLVLLDFNKVSIFSFP